MGINLFIIALTSALCFAMALVLTQFGLRTIRPFTGAVIALPITAVFFAAIFYQTAVWSDWDRESAATFAIVGLIFPVGITLLTFFSNSLVGPNLTGALGNLSPFFAMTSAIVLLDEMPNETQLAGAVSVCVGVMLVFNGNFEIDKRLLFWAAGLPLAAAILRGASQPLVKIGLIGWPSPLAAVTIGYITSSLAIGLFALSKGKKATLLPLSGFAWFAAIGLINGFAVLLLYTALELGPVTVVSPLIACYPLFTLILNRIFFGESGLSKLSALGLALTVFGVGLLLSS